MTMIREQFYRFLSWLSGGTTSAASADAETTDWCLVGNIVDQHEFGEGDEIRSGSKHFTPGTKVYCLPPQWGDGYEKAVVVGICRRTRRWITVVMRTALIDKWRAKVVYSPTMRERLRQGIDGFARQWKSREEVVDYVERMVRREKYGV
ncbi:MAG TPA: hypothetical protein VMP01_02195 [Pirellulaceae bacterium]|nr:hypothetical protein [Pirellulaceae bacterium]